MRVHPRHTTDSLPSSIHTAKTLRVRSAGVVMMNTAVHSPLTS